MIVRIAIVVHILFCWLVFPKASAQPLYKINGQIYVDNGTPQNVRVTLFLNGNKLPDIKVRNDGIFSTSLNWDKLYKIQFIKSGYVSKIIEFSTVVPNSIEKNRIEPYYLKVRLFPFFEGVDTVFFKNPVAKIRFDDELNDFQYDMDYSLSIKYKIEEMKKRSAEKKKQQQVNKTTNSKSTKKSYDQLIKAKQKNVKDEKNKVVISENSSAVEINLSEKPDIPILKNNYPLGRTIEEFDLEDKHVTRVIINHKGKRNVFLKVSHKWGAIFYFKDESPLTYRCITQKTYERETGLNE